MAAVLQNDYLLDDARLSDKLVTREADSPDLAIVGARIIDGAGGVIEKGEVLLRGARIAHVGGPGSLPATDSGTETLEAEGQVVMPGLIDCHVHLLGKVLANNPLSFNVPSSELRLIRAAFEYTQMLSWGVTTIRTLGHGPAEHMYAFRQAKREGLVRGPRLLSSGWALSQTRGHGDIEGLPSEWVELSRPKSSFADGPDDLVRAVRRNLGEGADCIKLYATSHRSGRPEYTVDEIRAITDEAHRAGRLVAAHVKDPDGTLACLNGGVDTIDHGPSVVDDRVIDAFLEHDAMLIPTLATPYHIAKNWRELSWSRERGEEIRRELEGRLQFVHAAHERGVRIAAGSDAAGWGDLGHLSIVELIVLSYAGLAPSECLTAATASASEALGISGTVGRLAPGMFGDLLILAADPSADLEILTDRSNIVAIIQSVDDPQPDDFA